MRLIGGIIVAGLGLFMIRVSDSPGLHWWADAGLCVGGAMLLWWANRDRERVS